MEVYSQIKKDLGSLLIAVYIVSVLLSIFDYGVDDTDKDGFNRSGVELITDYGTGLQYLYKSGAMIKRVDENGNHKKVK